MPTFLLKTEPGAYSFADLARDRRTAWAGVSNPGARIVLREMRIGDEAFVYHTGDERAVVGLARVVKGAYEDHAHPGRNERGEVNFPVVDVAPLREARVPLTLAAIKGDARFAGFELVTRSRLSVMRVPPAIDKALRALAGL